MTEKHRKNLSKALKGNTNRKGKKQSAEEVAKRVASRLKNGKKMSLEAKLKMREAKLKNPSVYWEGKNRPRSTKEKISKNLLGRYRGNKNPSWKGGKWAYVKRQVLFRDGYTCQVCGLKEEDIMEVDHIVPKAKSPELSLVMNNLITLCPNCHRRKTIREYKEKVYAR